MSTEQPGVPDATANKPEVAQVHIEDVAPDPDSLPEVMVEAIEVHKYFGRNQVLKGINMQVRTGEVACIIGPSGGGKSTFLRCINHLEKIDAGQLSVAGELIGYKRKGDKLHEMRDKEVAAQRRSIGMVFQRFNLFPHMTAAQNVMAGPVVVQKRNKNKVKERAQELLSMVGLGDRGDAYPMQLSGGQQQRVAIARALAMDPELMLFDEPTSALDPELVGDVLDVMKGLAASGMTMVVVTHEIGFAREVGDQLAFIADGVVADYGPPKELLANPNSERLKNFLAKVL